MGGLILKKMENKSQNLFILELPLSWIGMKNNFLIYDWRAPISSLYYDFAPGPAHYDTPEGTISGEMELKRQFIIRNGKIVSHV